MDKKFLWIFDIGGMFWEIQIAETVTHIISIRLD